MIKLWDSWIRLFHWSFAASVLFLVFSGETGTGFVDWHGPIGELVLALVVFRILWGFFGSSNASLLSLIKNPLSALSHLTDLLRRNVHQDRGHNAAGGWAVLIMLTIIGVQALTGLFIADEDEWVEGAFYGALSTSTTDWLYWIHHTNADFIQILIIVHVVMIALYWLVARQNLVWPMITGKMRWTDPSEPPTVHFRSFWIGLAIAAVVAAIYYGMFGR